MKTIIIVALASLLIALALPMLLTAVSAPPAPTETPEPIPSAGADAETTFSALTKGETATVTMAEWLPGALAGEMPALFEPEALKAQAVAARSYILSRKNLGVAAHPTVDVCDDPYCCKAHLTEEELRVKWGDKYEEYWQKMLTACTETDGEYLAYRGSPIQAVFHSSSAGFTEDAAAVWNALPYLVSVSSPETAADVPDYVTEVSFEPADFAERIRRIIPELELAADPNYWVGDVSKDRSGRVESVTVGGAKISGADVREVFSLRSTAFSIDYESDIFTFTVIGYGHGVGLSQYGANVMAKAGESYADILAHYYSGTELVAASR